MEPETERETGILKASFFPGFHNPEHINGSNIYEGKLRRLWPTMIAVLATAFNKPAGGSVGHCNELSELDKTLLDEIAQQAGIARILIRATPGITPWNAAHCLTALFVEGRKVGPQAPRVIAGCAGVWSTLLLSPTPTTKYHCAWTPYKCLWRGPMLHNVSSAEHVPLRRLNMSTAPTYTDQRRLLAGDRRCGRIFCLCRIYRY